MTTANFFVRHRVPLALVGTLGLGAWTYIVLNAQKAQRITSPIVKAVVYHLRHDPLIERELGTDIAIDKNSGVNGYVDHYKGKADVSFRVKGSAGEADVTYAGQRLRTDVWRSDVFRLKLVGKKENGNGNAGAKGMLDLL